MVENDGTTISPLSRRGVQRGQAAPVVTSALHYHGRAIAYPIAGAGGCVRVQLLGILPTLTVRQSYHVSLLRLKTVH